MARGRPGHLPSFDYIGLHRYFLTFCAHRRLPLFHDPATVTSTLSQFRRAAETEDFAIAAYCFMPDHVHLLVEGVAVTSNARRFFSLAKQLSGYAYHRREHAPLWQRDGYERVLRDTEGTLAVIGYILENPVRAGLARSLFEYRFSGSDCYSMAQLADLLIAGAGDWAPDR